MPFATVPTDKVVKATSVLTRAHPNVLWALSAVQMAVFKSVKTSTDAKLGVRFGPVHRGLRARAMVNAEPVRQETRTGKIVGSAACKFESA